MTNLKWTKKLSIGNDILDSEHRNLIGMVNDVIHAIRAKDCHALAQAIELLEVWLCVHFANEAKIAQAINFDFASQKPAQQFSLKELQLMRNELMLKNGMWPDRATGYFARFLKNWMIDCHIIDLNMPMKPALQAYDYKFWPGWCGGEAAHAIKADCSPALVISSTGVCGCRCDSYSSAVG